jgi:7-cyano-7-deazaguanine synthase in queuosine biosynthesis
MARILAFSAGMDSLIMKKLCGYPDSECLFVDMGTEENKQERALIERFYPSVQIHQMPIARFELPNKIIPFRNHLLAFIAAQFGTDIGFAFTAGDTTRDKDYVFKAQIEGALNYFCGIPEKSPFPGSTYSIFMPFKDMTKADMVRFFLERGHSPLILKDQSISCYEGKGDSCGVCRSCLRKFVALTLNGIECRDWFAQNPATQLGAFYQECERKNRQLESKDVLRCIDLLQE